MSVVTNFAGAYERSTGIPAAGSFTATFWFRWTAASLSGNFYQTAFALDNWVGWSYMQMSSRGGTSTAMSLFCGAGTEEAQLVDPGTDWYFYAIKGLSTTTSTAYYRSNAANALTSVAAGGANVSNRVFILTDLADADQRADQGEICAVKIWDTQLSDAEILAESYFVAPQRRSNLNSYYPFFKAGTTDEGGNGYTLTQLGTPISAFGNPPIRTRRAGPEYHQTTKAVTTNGTLAKTFGDIAISASGSRLLFDGPVAMDLFDEHANAIRWFIDDMPLSQIAAGTLTKTIDPITSSAAGAVAVNGTATKSVGLIESNLFGQVAVAGTLTQTIAAITLVADGTVAFATRTGTLTATIEPVTAAAVGLVAVAGSLGSTLAPVVAVAAGAVAVQGTAAPSLGVLTLATSGAVQVNGSASVGLGALALAADGAVLVRGALGVTIDPITLAATASTGSEIFGTLAQTIAPITLVATGMQGVLPQTEDYSTATVVVLSDIARMRVVVADRKLASVSLSDMSRKIVALPYAIRRSYGTADVTMGNLTLAATG